MKRAYFRPAGPAEHLVLDRLYDLRCHVRGADPAVVRMLGLRQLMQRVQSAFRDSWPVEDWAALQRQTAIAAGRAIGATADLLRDLGSAIAEATTEIGRYK